MTLWTIAHQAPLAMAFSKHVLLERVAISSPAEGKVYPLQDSGLEWVDFPFCGGSSQLRDQTQVSLGCRQIIYQLNHKGSPRILEWVAYPFSRGSS